MLQRLICRYPSEVAAQHWSEQYARLSRNLAEAFMPVNVARLCPQGQPPCLLQQHSASGTLLELLACVSTRAAGQHYTWSSTRVCVAGEVHAEAVDQSKFSRLKLSQ